MHDWQGKCSTGCTGGTSAWCVTMSRVTWISDVMTYPGPAG